MSVPPGKTTFTLPEAAELLSCHRETLRRAIRNGELRAAKLGRGFRISRTDLEAFWTASGGGDLFGREAESFAGPGAEKKPVPHRRGKAKNRQDQYSLPGTEATGGGTGPQGESAGAHGGGTDGEDAG